MKKLILIIPIIVILILAVFIYLYLSKPDLVILSVTHDKTIDSSLCKYNVEIKNKGFSPINSIVSYCFWPEGSNKCRFLSDVLIRNPETGITNSLYLKGRETYNFAIVPVPRTNFGENCPNKLYFCIDCNLHIVYDKEVIDGTIKESRESNNDYTYIESN